MLGHATHPVRPTHAPHPAHPTQPIDHALAWTGAVLATLPFVATLGLSLVGSLMEGQVLFDWLMPAELAIASFVGGLALLVVAWRTELRRWSVVAALAAAALFLGLTNGTATWTGLADGTYPPEGWRLALVLAVYVTFVLAAIAVATVGWLLVRDLGRARAGAPPAGASGRTR
jgi:hydrogenase/urease accessory protein HupE